MPTLIRVEGDTASILPEGEFIVIIQEGGDIHISYESVLIWNDEQRAEVNLLLLPDPDPPEEGFRSAGTTLEFTDGGWHVVQQLVALDIASERLTTLATLANLRWNATQTFTYDGVLTACDAAVSVVTGKLVAAQVFGLSDDTTCTWKLATNEFRTWTIPDLKNFGAAIATHIQACFDNEAALTIAVNASSTPWNVDIGSGWP